MTSSPRILPLVVCLLIPQFASADEPLPTVKKIAVITTAYYHNSHSDLIASRMLQTQSLDGKGVRPRLEFASLYTDQVPDNDTSRKFSAQYKFPIYDNIADTLTLGTGKLAVDGVLLICEHGKYPVSETGATVYPKRKFFEQIIEVFKNSGRVVPVFFDKQLSDNWQDIKWVYDTAVEMKVPLMAGSSIGVTWRDPVVDVRRGAKLKEIVAVSFHLLDVYGFHALEMAQCLAERRNGGETGIKAVQCFNDDAVWAAGERGLFDNKLLEACFSRFKDRPFPRNRKIRDAVPNPVLWVIDFEDGLRVNVLTLNGAVAQWAAAWRYADDTLESTTFWTQEWRPLMHFGLQLNVIEQMMHTGKPQWPVERTLLTSGVLDALLVSQKEKGKRIETPQLKIRYQADWNWKEPPPPPPNRPLTGQ